MTMLITYQDAPTKTVDIGGAKVAYRELGPGTGTPGGGRGPRVGR